MIIERVKERQEDGLQCRLLAGSECMRGHDVEPSVWRSMELFSVCLFWYRHTAI